MRYAILAGLLLGLCLAPFSCASEPTQTTELAKGWKLIAAKKVAATGSKISRPAYKTNHWHPIRSVPATVLEILEQDGVYPNVYYGMNLMTEVPQDLYEEDWWYRTSFQVPAGQHKIYWLDFPGINYRAAVWLNGKEIANNKQVVGMYVDHEFNVTKEIRPGAANVLAVRITPEQAVQGISGVELADSWFDALNWRYIGYRGKGANLTTSWVPDRNAGIWKPVYLHITGPVKVSDALVDTKLPLPKTSPAALTVYAVVENGARHPIGGFLEATISRPGKPAIHLKQPVTLNTGQTHEASFDPKQFPQLVVHHPDLWWPYMMGRPNLYTLTLRFVTGNQTSDTDSIEFGIREVTQHRDHSTNFPEIGTGGNFYLQINGKDFLARGADYAPDLLYKYDPQREATTIQYVKDMGLNMLRWEGKITSEHMVDLADKAGVPTMFGWMCCTQWESWKQWTAEDQWVARQSLRSLELMLRSHPSVFLWTNGSDGYPPQRLRGDYHRILKRLHWQDAVIDTVSSDKRGPHGGRIWDGIQMNGPYTWRPPSYWFSGKYAAPQGSVAEQGDNEQIPPYRILKRFIPQNKLWPINKYWYFHAGGIHHDDTLDSKQLAISQRYGPPKNTKDFARKAQLAQYEETRAQFEDFAANGWATHKMTIYWRLDDGWPSFFASLYGYNMKPAGAYYGAKQGLRPLSIVFDYYATGNHQKANIRVTNQTMKNQNDLRARVRIYDLDGKVRYDRTVKNIAVKAQDVTLILKMPRLQNLTSTYFIRCELFDSNGKQITDNDYWQSTTLDDLGPPSNDSAFFLKQVSWADFKALNIMPKVAVEMTGTLHTSGNQDDFVLTLRNPSKHIAFFERAAVTKQKDGDEVLPIIYSNNYVTIFPGETVKIRGHFRDAELAGKQPWLRLEGYNTKKELGQIRDRN